MKDAGATGASTARTGGGAGSGQPAASSDSCQARRGLWTQDAVIFSAPGRRRSGWVAPAAARLAMRRRGPVCRGAPASAGYGNGAALQITALVAGAESILHDIPRTKRIVTGGVAVRTGRGGLALPHFLPGVRSAWPWLKGCRVSRQAKRGARTARGEAGFGGGSECGQFCGGPGAQARAP